MKVENKLIRYVISPEPFTRWFVLLSTPYVVKNFRIFYILDNTQRCHAHFEDIRSGSSSSDEGVGECAVVST